MLNNEELIKALYEDIDHADDYNSLLEDKIFTLKLERFVLMSLCLILSLVIIF